MILHCQRRFALAGIIAITLAYAALTSATPANDPEKKPDADKLLTAVTFSIDEAKFGEPSLNFSNDGIRLSVPRVLADRATGRMSYLLHLSHGTDLRHKHTFSCQVVVLKGVMTHWSESLPGSEAKQLRAGSLWYAPAIEVHVDKCVTDECVTLSTTLAPGTTITIPDSRQLQ